MEEKKGKQRTTMLNSVFRPINRCLGIVIFRMARHLLVCALLLVIMLIVFAEVLIYILFRKLSENWTFQAIFVSTSFLVFVPCFIHIITKNRGYIRTKLGDEYHAQEYY